MITLFLRKYLKKKGAACQHVEKTPNSKMIPFILTLVSILIISWTPLGAGTLTLAKKTTKRWWISFAGGVSLAFIFVSILPDLATHQAALTRSEVIIQSRFTDFYVYLCALIGFVLFFGLERLILVHKKETQKRTTACWIQIGFLI